MALSQFSREIFADIINEHNGSIVISPLFVQSALALLLMGSDGLTLKIMKKRLGFNREQRIGIAKHFHSILQSYDNSSILKFATALYVDEEYPLNSLFQSFASDQFYSTVQSVNFEHRQHSVAVINKWVTNATDGKIKQIIKPKAIDAATDLLLLNAVYFHGLWQHEFATGWLSAMEFYTNGNCIRDNAKTIASVFDTVKDIFSIAQPQTIILLMRKFDTNFRHTSDVDRFQA